MREWKVKGQWFTKEFLTRICGEADDIKQTNLMELPAVQLWTFPWINEDTLRWVVGDMLATSRAAGYWRRKMKETFQLWILTLGILMVKCLNKIKIVLLTLNATKRSISQKLLTWNQLGLLHITTQELTIFQNSVHKSESESVTICDANFNNTIKLNKP